MTEPVRLGVSPSAARDPLGRTLAAGLVSLTLALAVPITSLAAPVVGSIQEGPATQPDAQPDPQPDAQPDEVPDEAAIRSSLADGDLTTARELAVARSEADPSADNFALEAEVWLALGDFERAKAALNQAIAALPEDGDREALEQLREQIEASSRGAVVDEPESTHRERFDRERADRLAALEPPTPAPSEPTDTPAPRVPIVKKWYFWVTLGAIVGTAGAIVGVAISASVDERRTTAASREGVPAGGLTIRF